MIQVRNENRYHGAMLPVRSPVPCSSMWRSLYNAVCKPCLNHAIMIQTGGLHKFLRGKRGCAVPGSLQYRPAGFFPFKRGTSQWRQVAMVFIWSGRRDLNPRLPAPKAGALPGCATPRFEQVLFSYHASFCVATIWR